MRVAVIGAGIAGASIAAELAGHCEVFLLEAEAHPGYHSTGRSAAFWSETYGGPLIQPLTSASGPFLAQPPADFHGQSLLTARGAIHIADADGKAALAAKAAKFAGSRVALEQVGPDALREAIPGLLPGWQLGLREPSCSDIDVAALHGAYLRMAKARGARLLTSTRIQHIQEGAGGWILGSDLTADIVVNAAGAWANEVALAAGVMPLGIQPYRRTIAQLRIAPPAPAQLPLVIDASERFYFKPEPGGRLWLSPHDETPCDPADCAPEEYDVALAIERLMQVVDWRVEAVEHRWAGLRSFAPDRLPVYGYDPRVERFFWFAGQGGFGIQTAPAAAKLAASLLLRIDPDPMVAGIDAAPYDPARFPA